MLLPQWQIADADRAVGPGLLLVPGAPLFASKLAPTGIGGGDLLAFFLAVTPPCQAIDNGRVPLRIGHVEGGA